ncbi:MAG TPA: sigma-70 family RNA polymerase sigma factor [Polyangiaceae bacterium]|nr:sigma-70 family RNA polymerase sigma factor [Polyangiaceae bacterium]
MTPLALPVSSTSGETSRSIREAHARGASAWPALHVTCEQFHSQIVRASGEGAAAPSHAEDFYFCVACTNADTLAHELLEAGYFPQLRQIVQGVVMDGAAVDDILQDLRMRLLAGASPKIATYQGRGALGSWLRKAALYAARDYCREKTSERRRQRAISLQQELQPRDEPDAAPRAANQNERECEQAWSTAKRHMPVADLQLLEHRFGSEMSIDTLGPIYAVHRATIARRVQRALQRARRLARNALAAEHRDLMQWELDAMMRDWCVARETSVQELG